MKAIILVDPRGNLSKTESDTFQRHLVYAKDLNKINSDGEPVSLVVLTTFANDERRESEFKTLGFSSFHLVEAKRFSPIFVIKGLKVLISLQISGGILVASDPWESFLSSWCIQSLARIFRMRLPMQVQLHADIFDEGWNRATPANRIREKIAMLSFRKADQIRTVNNHIAEKLTRNYSKGKAEVVVAPVPLNVFMARYTGYEKNRPRTIGFLGRLQSDRGLSTFLKIVAALNEEKQEFRVLIAGDGKERNQFLEHLSLQAPAKKIRYLGMLGPEQMEEFWSQIGVLISTSPSESYGRSIRESLIRGIPVVAIRNSGTESLLQSEKCPWLKLISNETKPKLISDLISEMMDLETDSLNSEEVINFLNGQVSDIVSSWIVLLHAANKAAIQ